MKRINLTHKLIFIFLSAPKYKISGRSSCLGCVTQSCAYHSGHLTPWGLASGFSTSAPWAEEGVTALLWNVSLGITGPEDWLPLVAQRARWRWVGEPRTSVPGCIYAWYMGESGCLSAWRATRWVTSHWWLTVLMLKNGPVPNEVWVNVIELREYQSISNICWVKLAPRIMMADICSLLWARNCFHSCGRARRTSSHLQNYLCFIATKSPGIQVTFQLV